jgi:O-Antigen ligase/Bacterial transcriptional activator domain
VPDRVFLHRWSALASALLAGGVLVLALRGGSYALAARHEAGVVAWWAIGVAVAFGVAPRARLPRGAGAALAGFALLAAWTAASLAWTQSAERTVDELARVVVLASVPVGLWLGLGARSWRPAAIGLAAGTVVVCALAVASRLAPGAFPDDAVAGALDTARLGYPFGYWNALAAFAAMSIAMALALSAHAALAWGRAAWLACVPVAGLAVYLTYSRAGVAGTLLGVVAVCALGPHRGRAALHALAGAAATALPVLAVRAHAEIADGTGAAGAGWVAAALLAAMTLAGAAGGLLRELPAVPPHRSRLVAAVAIALLVGATGVAAARGLDDFRRPTDRQGADPAARLGDLGGSRYGLWSSAARAFTAHPVEGVGAGGYEFWRNADGRPEFVRDAHSLYLELAAELGLPGLLAGLLALGGLGLAAVGGRRRVRGSPAEAGAATAMLAAFAVLALHLGVDWIWESTAVAATGLAAGAIAAVAGTAGRARPALAAAPRGGIVLVAALAVAALVPGLIAASAQDRGARALASGDPEAAVAAARSALRAQPWSASPYADRAAARLAEGRPGQAAADLREAIRREPRNWRHPLELARAEARLGRAGPALAAYRRARALRPGAAVFVASPQDALREALEAQLGR